MMPSRRPGFLPGLLVATAALLPVLWPQAVVAGPGGAALDLPDAGRVVDVAQTQFRDGYAQRITFSGGAQNYAEINLRTGAGGSRFGSSLAMTKPSQLGIAAELRSRFPGEVMRVSTVPRRNAYGPVGLALGSDCLYAWQWIDLQGKGGSRAAPPSLFEADTEGAASIRIRLCRTATASLSDLTRAVERMRLSAGSPERSLGGTSGRREPPQASSPPAPRDPRPRSAGRPAREAPKPPTLALPPPGAMERPGATETKARPARRPASETVEDRSSPSVPLPAQPMGTVPVPSSEGQGASPRYITDTLPRQSPTAPVAVPQPAQAEGGTAERLSTDLPMRAYRPPP